MRERPTEFVERCRIRSGSMGTDWTWGNNGVFIITSPYRSTLTCIVSNEAGWDHVSVSVAKKKRVPTWEEMCWVKDLFWFEEECVIQYHPPHNDYINIHPFVLHLWKPQDIVLPQPPHFMIGPKTIAEAIIGAANWGIQMDEKEARLLLSGNRKIHDDDQDL